MDGANDPGHYLLLAGHWATVVPSGRQRESTIGSPVDWLHENHCTL